MLFLLRKILFLTVLTCSLLYLPNATAEDLGSFGDRIFQFQEKLAKRGNVLAQYKLGTLYEFGISVPANNEKAAEWYRKAADKEYIPAINRLIYLDVLKNGFNPQKHTDWFNELLILVDSADANALILLGQMNHHGIHVKQDLNKALDLLSKASSYGHTEVDSEIDIILVKIDALAEKANAKKAEAKPEAKPKKKAPKKKNASKPKPKKSAAQRKKELEAKQKRQRYEAAMKKLEEESKILKQQQDWAEGN